MPLLSPPPHPVVVLLLLFLPQSFVLFGWSQAEIATGNHDRIVLGTALGFFFLQSDK